ncbi:MAG: helix-turn-helix transcriptional regulator [Spirochaetes bacterium]|nr:helix-turn-helix transcriptional regulator [Spirochaetota bacterium]
MFEKFVLINGIITHLCLLGAAQGIFLFLMLLRRSKADKVFSIIVLFISYELALHYLYKAHLWPEFLPLFLIKDTLGFMYGFLFLLYVRFLFGLRSRIVFTDIFHLLPAFVFFGISLFFNTPYLGYGTYSVIDFDESGITHFRFYSQNIKFLILFAYLIFSLKEVFSYRRKLNLTCSDERRDKATWLLVFLFAGFSLWMLSFLSLNYYYFESLIYYWSAFQYLDIFVKAWPFLCLLRIPFLQEILPLINSFITVISVYSAGYYILGKHSVRGGTVEQNSPSSNKEVLDRVKYSKNIIPESLRNEYLERIKISMDRDKPYLDSEFSIKDLSDKISVSTHNISQIINETFGKNFFSFVNDYRIRYAAEIISDTSKDVNILHASYDAGFNSKSVFNTVFKKKFGMTPSQYRNLFLRNAEKSMDNEI